MGQSTDAILVYGVDLGEDELPESLAFNDDDDDRAILPIIFFTLFIFFNGSLHEKKEWGK